MPWLVNCGAPDNMIDRVVINEFGEVAGSSPAWGFGQLDNPIASVAQLVEHPITYSSQPASNTTIYILCFRKVLGAAELWGALLEIDMGLPVVLGVLGGLTGGLIISFLVFVWMMNDFGKLK